MRRYARIYRVFASTSIVREMEFRANFFAKVLQSGSYLLFFVLIVLVIYHNTDSVAGWGRGDAFILSATVFLIEGTASLMFRGLMEIPEQVRRGTLDFVITKPIDSQFWVSTRKFHFDQIGIVISGVVLAFFGAAQSGLTPGPDQILAYLLLLMTALAIYYSFVLVLMTTGIWLVRVDNLWVLADNVTTVARYPLDIYALGLQRIFVFFVPLAFLGTVPVRQLTQGADWGMVALGLGWAGVALIVSRGFWRFALRFYTSASS